MSMLIIALPQLIVAKQVLEELATRDFNFGPPFLIILAALQVMIAFGGLVLSISKKPTK